VTHLSHPPKTDRAVVVELSQTTRAVIYGRSGATTFLRGGEAFALNDLEALKLEAARAAFLRPTEGSGQ
jgi:hypothetical protein